MAKPKHARGTHNRRERVPEPAEHRATVGDTTYQWELRHGWGVEPGQGPRGASVSVWVQRQRTRELIIDFPFELFRRETPPAAELLEAVERAIPKAIDAGWVGDSRGRAFRYFAADEGANET